MMQIKICTGCGWLNTKPLGENMYGKPYMACCPDNSYKDITAVEWLSIMLKDSSKELFDGNIWEQALAMEQEQHSNTWTDSRTYHNGDDYIGKEVSFEDYYKQTYNK